MRTTLQIDDDVYEAAMSLARSEGRNLGQLISRLARQGLMPRPPSRQGGGFPVFTVSPGTRPLTPDMVRQALDDGA